MTLPRRGARRDALSGTRRDTLRDTLSGTRRGARRRRSGPPQAGRRRGDDRGGVSVQAVITLPVIVTVTVAVLQIALVFLAHNGAAAAVQDGLVAAAGYRPGTGPEAVRQAGQHATEEYLRQGVGNLLADPTVTASVSGDGRTVTVQVAGHAYPVLPFLNLAVTASGAAPIETTLP